MFIVGFMILVISAGIHAGSTVKDVIEMNFKGYAKHEKSLVRFTHKRHIDTHKAGCGECHHDANNKPLNNLKAGDNVQSCGECHSKTGKPPKGMKKKEKIKQFHKSALHENCRDCHKKSKKAKELAKCKACHI
jgi:hypothetical protein